MDEQSMKPAEMLEQINTAIVKIMVGGQSYKIGSRSLTRADLATLKAMRDDLEAQITQEDSGGLLSRTYVAVFDTR